LERNKIYLAPEFSLPTIVDQGPTIGGVAFLTIHKRLDNTGNVPVDIAAESLTVFGEKVGPLTRHVERKATPIFAEFRADVPRQQAAVLFSMAKLRAGAIGGETNFYTPAHASQEETFLVAVPSKTYPVIQIARTDYVAKVPITRKILVRIIRTPRGAYALQSSVLEGEYDSQIEYPIRP
jgi:hypothetical protein